MTLILHEVSDQINMAVFSKVFDKNIKKIINVVRKYGFDIRIVGGAVRDFLLKRDPRDIDFATDAEPAELIFIFDLEGIEYDTSGIIHGTVKAVFGEDKIDVTSITYKMKRFNNSIKVMRSDSWEQDSKGRDLTINSMSLDLNGKLYDYQNGISDLKNQIVRFCPNAREKINNDPYVILRWFKAISLFNDPKWSKADQSLIKANVSSITKVKEEDRTKFFLASLMQNKNYKTILHLMCQLNAAKYLDLTCDI